MKLCVGFTGGNCSGKTTLSMYAMEQFEFDYSYLNQTRRIITEEYGGSLEWARENSFEFQTTLINHKIYWERKHKKVGFISDRTTLDNAAYFLAFTSGHPTPAILHYVDRAIEHARKTYDIIFCLSPLFDVQNDKLSPSDAAVQLRIYYTAMGLCQEMDSSKVCYITQTDIVERHRTVTEVLKA